MNFWFREVIQPALDRQTHQHVKEQLDWIAREPSNPRPYYYLAQLQRMENNPEAALGLLLESVRLDPDFAPAHVALAEMYAVRDDSASAWRHARLAERGGLRRAAQMLTRYGVKE